MSDEPTEITPALAGEPEPNDYPALFLQASDKLAKLAAEHREISALLPKLAAFKDLTLPQRIDVTVKTIGKLTTEIIDSAQRLEAVTTERAHLRQELDTAKAKVKEVESWEAGAVRTRRLFLEGLRAQPYERDVRELLERCEARVARDAE